MTTANGSEPRGGSSLFWLVYGQIAALLGAFSLLVFLTDFFNFGLKGVIQEVFDVWVTYVRPLVGHPLQALADLLPPEWRFAVPEPVKDYLAVGVVMQLSLLRTLALMGSSISRKTLLRSLNLILIWPLGVPAFLYGYWRGSEIDREGAALTAMFLAPLIYLGLLLAANAWLGSYCQGPRMGGFDAFVCGSSS